MHTPFNLFKARVEEWASRNVDYTVPVRDIDYALNDKRALTFQQDYDMDIVVNNETLPVKSQHQASLNDHAYGQLRSRFQAPPQSINVQSTYMPLYSSIFQKNTFSAKNE